MTRDCPADLGLRLGRAGYASVYLPTAVVTHLGGHSWRARPERMIGVHHASASRYLSRRYDRWYQAPVRSLLRVGLSARHQLEVRRARRG